MPDLSWLLSALKSGRKIAATVAVVCAALLFFPIGDVGDFVAANRGPLWIGFLAGVVFLLVDAVAELVRWFAGVIRDRRAAAEERQDFARTIEGLAEVEREILREFLRQGRRTIELPTRHPGVESLHHRRLIRPPGGVMALADDRALYTASDELWEYLQSLLTVTEPPRAA